MSVCRVCKNPDPYLVAPCHCSSEDKYIHTHCIKSLQCAKCNYKYISAYKRSYIYYFFTEDCFGEIVTNMIIFAMLVTMMFFPKLQSYLKAYQNAPNNISIIAILMVTDAVVFFGFVRTADQLFPLIPESITLVISLLTTITSSNHILENNHSTTSYLILITYAASIILGLGQINRALSQKIRDDYYEYQDEIRTQIQNIKLS
ncbi:MAG: hypothetical protein Harvfovirus53_4 [Harvfovirus sp.]|uniref:RING-CH-type domain-containing protein n=1 Tax=Harvfovirus sp. TaxID=2487768 RepID=A0A3G5A5B1_9VIRU|nr:MAG: hypothetical protein Harvfovirus53_4 [Harvfovirus sp.]